MQLCNASIDHNLCMYGVRSSRHAYPGYASVFQHVKLICTIEEAQVFFDGSMSFDSPKIVAFMHHLHIHICKSTCISIQWGGPSWGWLMPHRQRKGLGSWRQPALVCMWSIGLALFARQVRSKSALANLLAQRPSSSLAWLKRVQGSPITTTSHHIARTLSMSFLRCDS